MFECDDFDAKEFQPWFYIIKNVCRYDDVRVVYIDVGYMNICSYALILLDEISFHV